MIAKIIKQANPKGMPIVYASVLGTFVLCIVIGLVLGWLWYMIFIGLMLSLTVGLVVFGQLAQKAQYSILDGQVGAAAAVLQGMRGNWEVTPAVAVNRDQDVVHRVVGYPGIVLVGEGPGGRVQKLLVAEKKRVQRVAVEVPVYDIQCGDGEGQIPLAKLQRHLMKLPRNLKKPAVSEINYRLRALPQNLPLPKGPLPKGARMPRGPKTR
ncbi:membrane protein [Sinosporangium siamense]|uniref:Membrane protein n=2 Tax=Sinosporangium siamense TaxID=1367973 RepID=A0A919RA52_9ACTN|nr:membrane protein [Sinosporangium siamense]